MAAPPPPPASPLNTLTPIVPRNPRIPRRGPSQHKGEPENHAQALEASPSRALTRPTKPTARLGHTIHPHPAPVAALAVAVGASQRQTVAVGPSRPTGPLGPSTGGLAGPQGQPCAGQGPLPPRALPSTVHSPPCPPEMTRPSPPLLAGLLLHARSLTQRIPSRRAGIASRDDAAQPSRLQPSFTASPT